MSVFFKHGSVPVCSHFCSLPVPVSDAVGAFSCFATEISNKATEISNKGWKESGDHLHQPPVPSWSGSQGLFDQGFEHLQGLYSLSGHVAF